MTPLTELQWSDVYLFNDQKHKGRCVVALKGHHDEMFELDDEQRSGFFAEVSLMAHAIANYTKADKINYAIYGDIVSHFHVHLVPKHRDCSATSFLRNWDSILEKKRANLRSISEPARLRQPPPQKHGSGTRKRAGSKHTGGATNSRPSRAFCPLVG